MNPGPPTFRCTLEDLNRPVLQILPTATETMSRFVVLPSQAKRLPRIRQIVMHEVSHAFGMPVKTLLGRSRPAATSWARQVLYYFLREFTGASQEEVGKWLGRDHVTIAGGTRNVRDKMDVYPQLRAELEALRAKIQARITAL